MAPARQDRKAVVRPKIVQTPTALLAPILTGRPKARAHQGPIAPKLEAAFPLGQKALARLGPTKVTQAKATALPHASMA